MRRESSDSAIADALRTFAGVPHRLELVRELSGVRFVNDSKATNAAAARRGAASYGDAPLRLILGGSRKGEDFGPFARELPRTVRSIYLIGESADELAAALDAAGRDYVRAGDLAHAPSHAPRGGGARRRRPALAGQRELRPVRRTSSSAATTFRRLVEELA